MSRYLVPFIGALSRRPGSLPEEPGELGDPGRDIRTGLLVVLAFFVVFIGWAAFARVDAAAFAQGQLVVSGQRKPVQHQDGGVVNRLLVRDGDTVTRGEVLVTLATSDVLAAERALTAQEIGLIAQRARLLAEQSGQPYLDTPIEFARLSEEDRQIAEAATNLQRRQLLSRASLLTTQQAVLDQQSAQSMQEAEGARRQMESTSEQRRLMDEELSVLSPIAEKGFVSKSRIRALERARVELDGQSAAYAAGAAQAQAAVAQGRMQVAQALSAHYDRVAEEMRDVEAALRDVQPRAKAARERLARTEIRAPAAGTVVDMTLAGPGEVVQAGQKLMEIVPEDTPLVIEARIAPADSDDLHVGQQTRVRFSSINDRSLPDLAGTLTNLSADSLEDERTGTVYFRAEVTVPADQIALIRKHRGEDFELKPGMPVDVLVPLRKRTVLQYLFEPLTSMFWKAFREH